MPKVTIVGAGSAVFARQIVTDMLAVEGLDPGVFALVDIDAKRLELARALTARLVERSGKRWKLEASTERGDVLKGSDYVINSIEVAGLQNVRADYDIPMRYGVDQCIGDTIGPGGIFKALRTGPVWLEIVRDTERLAPTAMIFNYTNPMSILTLAGARSTSIPMVGLCHSVQGTSQLLAELLEVPYAKLKWRCAGINHNAWFTTLETDDGEDLYPRLRERAREPDVYERDPIRFEVMLRLGAFVTESSGHFSEYVPYFRKRADLIRKYTRGGYLGESGYYANNWPDWRRDNDERIEAMLGGKAVIPHERSHEYASYIVEAIEKDQVTSIHGNVVNDGAIANLPDGCIEVECRVARGGIHAVRFGKLPEQLAALNRAHMAVHELMVQSLLEHDRTKALYALSLDPLTAAVCSLAEIESMFLEMWEAQRDYLGVFQTAVH
ncbi:MAG TPA: alpha-glucosidase/alpha-galactosidase [Blastocatellia bacterium]|jgi:alpha-galactosidase|nr:alpha-glucosidase/alpha-galactosidase [Blastocatellia bacterium]